jgi:putative salt-induced outer membrane protein YdiY
MSRICIALITLCGAAVATTAMAQTPPAEPPPLWDAQVGASFVGTSGNSRTSSAGVDFSMHRRSLVWLTDANASLVRTTDRGVDTAERYLASVREQRSLSPIVKLTGGERAEHDPFSGIGFRNILDAGLGWAVVRQPRWTLDATTSIAWNHESAKVGPNRDDAVGVLQVLSRIPFGSAGDTTGRVTFYPDFSQAAAYRAEAEVTAQAAMSAHLALKLGYLLRFSNAPVSGFLKTDNTATASVVVRWRASTPAPGA